MFTDPRSVLTQTFHKLRRTSRILWVRVALITGLAVLAALSAELFEAVIPHGSTDRFSQSATLPILTILANGMLAVATFSLGVMVSSHRTLAEQSTPRIHRLLMEDTSTQSMLATFIGAFVFSLVAIILFNAGYYSDDAAVIVFAATVLVVGAVVVSLVRWISQLTRIGSMEYALDRAENAARETFEDMRSTPLLGGRSWAADGAPAHSTGFDVPRSGFLSRVDMEALQELAEQNDAEIYLAHQPGDRILSGEPLGWIVPARADAEGDAKPDASAFVIANSRTVEQDPRFALIILREAAAKALSPGINDQGTAIEVIARLERLLWDEARETEAPEPAYPRVYLPELSPEGFLIHAFRGIARDGAAHGEVMIVLIDAVARLSRHAPFSDGDAGRIVLQDIHDFAMAGLATEREKDRVRAELERVGFEPDPSP
ncbi:DUF2254 domain-containing protein [Poseidonocella sedimentorum]|uniref:Uncharacterized membrane protein n=1 Tax=Poseidonocella sedimentorum TaxID=871652 RepID=A0A1I6DI67_9RHOB|nr:DUF2254 domain-containing protein [Poseidonocella sedimentorum]SFR05134.1 Uncharacterized membrane protein [Poseidonocella sedimentorum]